MKLKSSLMWGTALGALALVLLLGTADTAHAGTFNPNLQVAIADPSAGAHSDYTVSFNLPEGDVQFAGLVIFIPPEWGITPSKEIPLGTVVGELKAKATLGIINGACNNVLTVEFTMLNSSIDINDTVDFEDTDISGDGDVFEDKNNNGIADGVDKYPAFITRALKETSGEVLHPIRRAAGTTIVAGIDVLLQFLVFEPGTFISENLPSGKEFGYPTITLLQAIGDPQAEPEPGAITDFCTPLSSTNTTFGIGDACKGLANDDSDDDDKVNDGCPAFGKAEFDACANNVDDDKDGVVNDGCNGSEVVAAAPEVDQCANHEDDDYTDDLAAATAAGDPLGAEERIVNDGCPKVGDTSEGDITHVLFTNPPEGSYTFTTVGVGQRDADSDGFENTLDTCPFDVNLGDPRISGDGDDDSDGIDGVCDPNPTETNSDQDADGYLNRQDNCPLDANGQDADNQADGDTDGIGDACDPNPDDKDAQGALIFAKTPQEIAIGPPAPGQTPEPSETPSADGKDDGGGSSSTIIIIIAVIAGVVVVGGGGFYFMRRRGGGGGATT